MLARVGTGSRWFVEFGASQGVEGNRVFLADVLGWSGLFLESDDEAYAALTRKSRHRRAIGTATHP